MRRDNVSRFRIYRNDGVLRHPPNGQARDGETTIVEDLMQSAHADVYLDLEDSIVFHRFLGRCTAEETDRVNEYYAVYRDPTGDSRALFRGLWNHVRYVFESGRWKGQSENPHERDEDGGIGRIEELAEAPPLENRQLSDREEQIVYHLQEAGSALQLGVESRSAASIALRTFSVRDSRIVIGKTVFPDRFPAADLIIEYGDYQQYEPLNADTRERLRTSAERLRSQRFETAIADFRSNSDRSLENLILSNPRLGALEKAAALARLLEAIRFDRDRASSGQSLRNHLGRPVNESSAVRGLSAEFNELADRFESTENRQRFVDEIESILVEEHEELLESIRVAAVDELQSTLNEQTSKLEAVGAGSRSERPIHDDLLDRLAARFDESDDSGSTRLSTVHPASLLFGVVLSVGAYVLVSAILGVVLGIETLLYQALEPLLSLLLSVPAMAS